LHAAYLADESRLRQIIGNLVSNAIKFTQRGAITLTVRLVGEDRGRALLKFSVTDSGPGLAPAFRQRAFDLFTQGPDSQGSVNGGVGLGLGIVKSLVDLMGGHVEVDSVQGVGSTFSFTIPLERTEAVAQQPIVSAGAEPTKPCRVLLVDDNAAGRQVSGSLLAHLGAAVTPVSGGQEALDCYISHPEEFDLVLMDVRMPDMDGHEATRRLRQWEASEGQGRHVQVVALTANSAPSDQLQARAAGMDGYLTKPVRLIDLRNLLRAAQNAGS
jgi:CheY-like chemotaxis protein/anti-sigma regulatory factor (Ser/Thr protein kinase)